MAIPVGTYELGPGDGTLVVLTKRTGAAAMAGHDLVIDVTAWRARLVVAGNPAESALELEVDGGSLRVREGSGGMQALGDDDKANIDETIDEEVLHRDAVAFRSSDVQVTDGGLDIRGDLTLLGATRPLAFDVGVGDDGALSAVAVIKQSDWGMKPYSALFGTLKVVDEVEVAIEAVLPQAGAAASARSLPRSPTALHGEPAPVGDGFPVVGAWTTVALLLAAEIVLLWLR